MALTPAEKQRRYREKRDNDLERRSSYLAKQQNKYIKEKETGKRKLIGDMSAREKRSQRKYWKNSKQAIRKRQTDMNKLITPPNSPILPNVIIPAQLDAQSRQLSYSRRKIRRQKK